MPHKFLLIVAISFATALFNGVAAGQEFTREFRSGKGTTVEITNEFGRVDISAAAETDETSVVKASSPGSIGGKEIIVETNGSTTKITVSPATRDKRIDISATVSKGTKIKIITKAGEVRVSGSPEKAEVTTDTGTIAADVPLDDLKYELIWTLSKPRIVSDFKTEKIKEISRGRSQIKGKYSKEKETTADDAADELIQQIELNFTTARGIILLNVPPSEVADDLRDRPLTVAAKAVIRSGDSILTEAIRRVSPKRFDEYTSDLAPIKREPILAERLVEPDQNYDSVKIATVRVTGNDRRAIADLTAADFKVAENGGLREVLSVKTSEAPFNLVLLLDVSGSIDNYVNFIRKAARNFVETVGKNDRVSIIVFNDDVKVLSTFSKDKTMLSESLDTFDAGGSTAYYDALAYTIVDTLRPFKGEQTAIVVLTDGDDNRSFLSFDTLKGAISESGALIYPLYVPSSLVAASSGDLEANIDPLRSRFMTLTSKSEGEGAALAEISGGVYYPITQLSLIQTAYEDIVRQLRTSYAITYRSTLKDTGRRASPRLRITTTRPGSTVIIGSIETIGK